MTIRASDAGRKKNVVRLSKKGTVTIDAGTVAEDMWR